MDSSISLSETMRVELLLEMSGISRQEILVTKPFAKGQTFEDIVKVLIQHHGTIHLKEGSRSWTGSPAQPFKGPPKGKGKSYGKSWNTRTAYVTYPETWEDEEHDHHHWGEEPEDYVGLLGGIEEEEEYVDDDETPL